MKEDILSVQKMKHKLVTFYLFLLVVACFCQVAVKKEDIAACITYSLNCLDAAKSDDQRVPIPYEFASLTQSTNSTGQQALAIGLSIALIVCCCCTCIIGIVITILIVACVGFSTVLAVFSPCLIALGCGACVGAVGGCNSRCGWWSRWRNCWRIKSSIIKIYSEPFQSTQPTLWCIECISKNLLWMTWDSAWVLQDRPKMEIVTSQ
jgi:hypothetical protein